MEFYNKDIQILRQSQIKIAFEFLTAQGFTFNAEELQRVTDVFVECGMRPMDDDLKTRIKELDKWILKKKNETNNQ